MFKGLRDLWNAGRAWLSGADGASSPRRREEDNLRARLISERAEDDEREDREEFTRTLETVLISTGLQRAAEELARDVEDAIAATRLAYERALEAEERAREALEEARRNALVLADGRRVYFSGDGKLYGEDGNEITDLALIGEAQQLHRDHPGATSYETITQREREAAEAAARVQKLAEALDKLDDLQRKVAAGIASPEELRRAREELQEILETFRRRPAPTLSACARRGNAAALSHTGSLLPKTRRQAASPKPLRGRIHRRFPSRKKPNLKLPKTRAALPAYRSIPEV